MQPGFAASLERRIDARLFRHADLLACVSLYLVLLGLLVRAWANDPHFLHTGRDGVLTLWLLRANAEWGSASSLTTLNPFQGMGSTLLPINPWWVPASLFSVWWPERITGWILSFIAYHAEFTASILLLGRCLGLSLRKAFFVSLWLSVLLFPPFNYAFGLHSWLGTLPPYAHTLALGNVMASILLVLGSTQSEHGSPRRKLVNAGLVVLFALALVAILFAAPFYNAGMLGGYALLFGAIVVATRGWPQRGWQGLALVAAAATFRGLGAFDFLGGAFGMSGRFAEQASLRSLFELQMPEQGAWEAAKTRLCGYGLLCNRFHYRWSITGSWWLHFAILLGGLRLATGGSGRLARLGGMVAVLWAALLGYWLLVALGVMRSGPLGPVYLFLPLYPMLGILSLEGIKAALGGFAKFIGFPRVSVSEWSRPARVALFAGFLLVLLWGGVATGWRNAIREPALLRVPRMTPLVEVLERETALHPGMPYRGSVVTVLRLGEDSFKGAYPTELQQLRLASRTGNGHALLDLWWFWIPTLEEYGQGVTRPLREYARRYLSDAAAPPSTHFISVTKIEPEILQILGVRFIVTDRQLPASIGALKSEGPEGLRVYELRAPNLGDVSPTKMVTVQRADEVFDAIAANPALLRRTAFTAQAPLPDLVPAQGAKLTMIQGGVTVAARSEGTSALLLPLQFSNCLALDRAASRGEVVRIERANVLHTLLVFRGPIEATLRWRYGYGAASSCRLQDVAELRKLGL
jgi:hypothetical protein